MKISILTPDLSHNCLGRAYLLAKILQRRYEVEIIGPIFGDGIWEPLAKVDALSCKGIKVRSLPRFPLQIREILEEIKGDVTYASKPLFSSFGMGLLKKLAGRKPLDFCFGLTTHFITRRNYRGRGDLFEKHISLSKYLSKQDKLSKITETAVMFILTQIIKPFEYIVPRFRKSQSEYVLLQFKKR